MKVREDIDFVQLQIVPDIETDSPRHIEKKHVQREMSTR